MKKFVSLITGLLLMQIPLPSNCGAVILQQEKMYRIETTDGNIFLGTLITEDEERVIIRTENLGDITISRANIRSMTEIDPARLRNGQYWFENPHATRYFFTTNAIGLRKGQGYYQNTWILFNNVNYGITDNVSLGGGLIPMFLFGVSSTPVWLLPKLSIPVARENVHLAAGGLVGGVIGDYTEAVGMLYGVATVGSRDRNVTVGLGYGYAGREFSSTPVINVSGMTRSSRTIYIISENYFFSGDGDLFGILSAGIRWAPEKFALDFALFRPIGPDIDSSFIGIPWLGVTLPFGKSNHP